MSNGDRVRRRCPYSSSAFPSGSRSCNVAVVVVQALSAAAVAVVVVVIIVVVAADDDDVDIYDDVYTYAPVVKIVARYW